MKEENFSDRLLADDLDAFQQLYDDYKDKLFFFLLRLTESRPIAEDLLQDVFMKVWSERAQLKNVQNLNAWLFCLAKNQAMNCLNRMARETLIMAKIGEGQAACSDDPEKNTGEKELNQLLQAAIDKLTPKQRVAFLLSREGGARHKEIARQMNISPLTVKKHITQALQAIRGYLGKEYLPLALLLLTNAQIFF